MNLKNGNGFHYLECRSCGFKDDRDHIAIANIAKRFLMMLKRRIKTPSRL